MYIPVDVDLGADAAEAHEAAPLADHEQVVEEQVAHVIGAVLVDEDGHYERDYEEACDESGELFCQHAQAIVALVQTREHQTGGADEDRLGNLFL